MAPPVIRLENIAKSFGGVAALSETNLEIMAGEFFSLLGPSGCGKTTLLRLIAGFEIPDRGKIEIAGKNMGGKDNAWVEPYDRPVNMTFQSYALFPHMTVAENISFGLKQQKLPKDKIKPRVAEMLALVKMETFAQRKPHQLSGGERQRVALARCLARRPAVVLLDEPLAALDKRLREQTRAELVSIQKTVGTTFVMVTHDQEEAMAVSTRIAVMEKGSILQVDTPRRIYENPKNRAVAEFIGAANFLDGEAVSCANGLTRVRHGWEGFEFFIPGEYSPGTLLAVMIRPENFTLETSLEGPGNRLKGAVTETAYLGGSTHYKLRLKNGKILSVTLPNTRHGGGDISPGREIILGWTPADGVVLT